MLKSFEDCPNHCKNGEIFDRKLKKKIPCPYCAEKRRELVEKGIAISDEGILSSLSYLLGVESEYMKAIFNYNMLIPEAERIYIEKESLENQKKISEELYSDLTLGNIPKNSFCFGLGNKGRVDKFAYPMLAKAYQSGLNVSKFLSCDDYNRMKLEMSSEVNDLFTSDFVIMLISDGANKADIAAAKGLMQTRGLRGKPTIFVTTWSIEACSMLLGYWNDPSLLLALPSFVEYRSNKKGHSRYINDLTGVDNELITIEDKQEPQDNGVSMIDLLG